MSKYTVLKEFKVEGQSDPAVGSEVELSDEVAETLKKDGVVEAVREEKKPELTPEEKTKLRRTTMYADMMVSFRQDIEGISMNLERLTVNKRFWQRRYAETKGKDATSFKKAEESLMNIEKQFADLALALVETKNFMGFLDEVMSGKVEVDFSTEVPDAKTIVTETVEEAKA